MAFVPFEDCVSISICGTLGGQRVCITLSACKPDLETSDMEALAEELATWVDVELCSDLSEDITFDTITVTDLSSDTGPVVNWSFESAGGIASPSVPNGTAIVVTFYTEARGRSYRGRNYIPGVPENARTSSTTISGTVATNLAVDYALMAEAMAQQGFTHVVASRYHNGNEREIGVATLVTSYSVGADFDSQRRRLAGRGE